MTDETMREKPKAIAIKVRNVPNCLFHRVRQSVRRFLIEDRVTKERVSYGLCRPCNNLLTRKGAISNVTQEEFKQRINAKLIAWFDREEGEGANGTGDA